ncbi:MAG: asparagine synthase-related protein, partial [Nitrospinota bacterium]
ATTAFIRNFSASRLKTFSVAFEDETFDESVYQQEMAKALGTEHSVIRCSYSDIGSSFPDVIWHTEKPILRTAPAPLFLLSRLVRENDFKVVLTGQDPAVLGAISRLENPAVAAEKTLPIPAYISKTVKSVYEILF